MTTWGDQDFRRDKVGHRQKRLGTTGLHLLECAKQNSLHWSFGLVVLTLMRRAS